MKRAIATIHHSSLGHQWGDEKEVGGQGKLTQREWSWGSRGGESREWKATHFCLLLASNMVRLNRDGSPGPRNAQESCAAYGGERTVDVGSARINMHPDFYATIPSLTSNAGQFDTMGERRA